MADEQYGFVFAVIFMIVFGSLLATIPLGLQGPEEDPITILPIDPNLISGFAESEGFNVTDFTGIGGVYEYYEYSLASRDWRCGVYLDSFLSLYAKVYFLGFWFGQIDTVEFTAPDGTNRGEELSLSSVQGDSENGVASYSLMFSTTGDSVGSMLLYWNVTEYPTFTDAWDDEEVYLLHGVGIDVNAGADIAGLLISLLFLRLPDVPPLVNVLLATPVWASIIFILWYIVKEMIPFL